MTDEHENLEIDLSIGKEPSDIRTAESYLRGFARYPADRGTDLMPEDSKWVKGVRRLYDRLSDSDKGFIDSFASDEYLPGSYLKAREKRMKYLSLLLLTEVGKESIYTIILPDGVSEYGRKEKTV